MKQVLAKPYEALWDSSKWKNLEPFWGWKKTPRGKPPGIGCEGWKTRWKIDGPKDRNTPDDSQHPQNKIPRIQKWRSGCEVCLWSFRHQFTRLVHTALTVTTTPNIIETWVECPFLAISVCASGMKIWPTSPMKLRHCGKSILRNDVYLVCEPGYSLFWIRLCCEPKPCFQSRLIFTIRMRIGNVFTWVCLSVCLSVCPCVCLCVCLYICLFSL